MSLSFVQRWERLIPVHSTASQSWALYVRFLSNWYVMFPINEFCSVFMCSIFYNIPDTVVVFIFQVEQRISGCTLMPHMRAVHLSVQSSGISWTASRWDDTQITLLNVCSSHTTLLKPWERCMITANPIDWVPLILLLGNQRVPSHVRANENI